MIASLAAALARVLLPAGATWSTVMAAGGKVVASGPLAQGPNCVFLRVDPVSLHSARTGGSDALYHASSRIVAVRRSARAALCMTAHGRTLWVETVTGTSTFRLWRYDDTHGRLLWTRQRADLVSGTTYGAGALWGVSSVDELTGGEQTIATVR